MGSLIEMLANKKKAVGPPEAVVILPVMHKEHEGTCGPNCECAGEADGSCCGG